MNEKLSKDDLISKLEELEKLRFVGDKLSLFEHNHHKALSFKQSKTLNIIYKEIWEYSHQIGKLRQRMEAQAEPNEAELEEFVEKEAKVWGHFSPRQKEVVKDFIWEVIKEYDKLRTG